MNELFTMNAYLITNYVNGKQYVGITTKPISRRWTSHASLAAKGSKHALHAAIRKYGLLNFSVQHIASGLSINGLKETEIKLIEQYGSRAPNGYNMTDGGDGTNGLTHSLSSRLKISMTSKGRKHTHLSKEKLRLAHIGKRLSDEHKEKLSIAHKGKHPKRTMEHNAKIAAARIGYKFSKEAKLKMSLAKKGKPWSQARRDALK